MAFLNRLAWIFVSPTRVLDDISAGRATWWEPWVWSSLLFIAADLISLPVSRAVADINAYGLPPEQLQVQRQMLDNYAVLMLGVPALALLRAVFFAGITYVLVAILSERANFRQYFTLTLYVSLIAGLSMVVSTVVVRLRGVDAIRGVEDSQVTLGLGLLAPEGHPLVSGILSTINIFSVWSLFVLGLGLMRVFGMSRSQAIACVIPWWVITLIFVVGGAALGGLR